MERRKRGREPPDLPACTLPREREEAIPEMDLSGGMESSTLRGSPPPTEREGGSPLRERKGGKPPDLSTERGREGGRRI
jgi:hypothetical protein